MNNEYKKELKEIQERMEAAEKFAEKLPLFREQILSEKLSEDDCWIKFGERYKDSYLAWGICRGHYKSGTNRSITNMKEEHDGYYFHIYINQLSVFFKIVNVFDIDYGDPTVFGLYDKIKDCSIFFIDHLNTTFYVEDAHIEQFLETLNEWYMEANVLLTKQKNEEKIKKLKAELESLES